MAPWRLFCHEIEQSEHQTRAGFLCLLWGYLSKQFCLGNLLVDLLGKVLVGLERGVRHLGWLLVGMTMETMDE